MLSRLVAFSLTQRLLMVLASIVLMAAGWWSYQNTPVDAFPDVSTPQIKVILKAPGMTPEEIEARVTSLIEREMMGIPGIEMLRSTTKYGLADITLDFQESTEIYWARNQVDQRLSGIWGDLPSAISGGVAPLTTPLGEVLMFTIEGGDLSLSDRRTLLDWTIRPALRSVPGVADVNSLGGFAVTYEVVPDPVRMMATGVTLAEIRSALEMNNRNDGAGRVSDGEQVLLVRVTGAVNDHQDIGQIIVKGDPVNPLALRDVATVRTGSMSRYGGVTKSGQGEVVEGLVLGLRGANTREVVSGVRARLAELQPSLPEGVEVKIFYDRGNLIDNAVAMITEALIASIVLVAIALLVFLGDWRAALSVALVLPMAAMATFLLMKQFGLSSNLMSLGGLVIAIGMLVDASIVAVENMVTRLNEAKDSRLPRLHVCYRAVSEVAVPVAAGIGIIVIVFLPLISLEGLEGKLFRPVALIIVFALASSLVLSLTIIPVIASFLLGKAVAEPAVVRWLLAKYQKTLHWVIGNDTLVLMVSVALLVVSAVLYAGVGKTFMPTMDEGDMIVQLEKLPEISLEESLAMDLRFEKAVMERVPEVLGMVARTGSDEIGLDPMGLNQTDGFLMLKPRSEWRQPDPEWLQEEIRAVLHDFKGVAYAFTQPIQMRVDEMLTGVRGDLAIKIFGPDQSKLTQVAKQVEQVVAGIEGATDVIRPTQEGQRYLVTTVDPLAAGRFGLTTESLAEVLRTQLEGMPTGLVYAGDRRVPIVVKADADIQASPALYKQTLINLPNGQSVPLEAIATVEATTGPVSVNREMGTKLAFVIANVGGRDLVGFVEAAKAAVAEQVELPEGVRLAWGGEFENQQRAAARLGLVIPVALFLIGVILFVTLKSMRQTILVLGMIPLALIGGVVALFVTGEYLSVPASVGFIALLGIAVMNGVVLITYFNQLLARGMALSDVVVEGAVRRLRPVLTTATITALGLVPLALSSGPGSEIQKPLAIVVIGGVISSTLLTLVVLPILFKRYGVGVHHDLK